MKIANFARFSLVIVQALAAVVIGFSSVSPASAQVEGEEFWSWVVFQAETDHYKPTPKASCKTILGGPLPQVHYQGDNLEYVKNDDDRFNSSGIGYRTCVDNNDKVQKVKLNCKFIDSEGVERIRSGPCEPLPLVCPGRIGNPIELATQAKIESATDWTAPNEPRFRLKRTYRSDFRNLLGKSQKGLGYIWRQEFSEMVTRSSNIPKDNRIRFYGSDGATYHFYKTSGYPAVFPGHNYSLEQVGYRGVIDDGRGFKREFSNFPLWSNNGHLAVLKWPDGYRIEITRQYHNDSRIANRITHVEDNKGNRMEYVWVQIDNDFWVIDKINVGTVDDVDNFSITNVIDYTYAGHAVIRQMQKLITVDLIDPNTPSQKEIARYTYSDDTTSFPPALKTIGTGDGTFGFFEYLNEDNLAGGSYPAAEITNHFGDVDGFEVTPDGDRTLITNPLGKVTEINYETVNGIPRVSSVVGLPTISCLGTAKSFGYTPNAGAPEGYIYERIERNGARTTFTRDGRGLVLIMTEDADGLAPRTTTYTWHASLRLPLTRSTSELQESFTYDDDGLLTGYTQTDVLTGSPSNGMTRSWAYNYTTLASGLKVLTSTDGPGLAANGVMDVAAFTYNTDGTMATSTDPNGLVTNYQTYDNLGNVTRIVLPDGVAWTMTYDHEGQLLSSTENADASSANTMTFVYDVIGQMTSYTDGLSRTWSFNYDLARRLKTITNPAGETNDFTHDLAGNITKAEYSDNSSAVQFFEDFAFDELSRLKSTLGAVGQTVAFTYDEEDNLKTAVDAISLTTTNSYDALNRLVQAVDRASGTTLMEHNDADQVKEYTDPRGIDTDFVYNGFGEVVQEVSADRGTMTYTYDERGLVTSVTDGRGIVSNYTYDDGGRLTDKTFPTATTENQQFVYDGAANGSEGEGKIATITDESGSIYREYADGGYVSLERRTIETGVYDTAYDFDAYGRLASTITPGQLKIDYTYDTLDRVSGITVQRQVIDPGTGQFPPAQSVISGVTYKPFGPLASLTYGDTGVQTRSYDSSYRMTGLVDQLGLTTLRDKSYSWTARNNLATASDALDALKTETYQYSAREFLAQATGPYDQIDYTYDAVGNRATRSVLASSTVTDIYAYPITSNQLTSIAQGAGGTRSFTYDAAGNVTYDNQNGGGYGYAYNAAGRMESFSINGVVQAEYVYNALGQQTVRRLTQAGHTIHSVHDADGNRLAEYQIDNVSGAATLLQEYIWHDGVPVAVVDGATDAVFFVRTDHIGRPVFATSDTGVKVWEATYLPFGGMHSTTGSAIDLRFPGQWFQSESGLHQNWMREYDPTTGRYIQGDPLGLVDGASVYGYALQNPGRYTDPTGEFIPALAAGFLAGYGGFMTGHELGELIFGNQCIDLGDLASLGLNFIPGGGFGKNLPDVLKNAFGKGGRNKGFGDLTKKELEDIQNAVDKAGRPVHIVGSAATGTRRGVGTNLPTGKGPNTKSDIDILISPSSKESFNGVKFPDSVDLNVGSPNSHIGDSFQISPR